MAESDNTTDDAADQRSVAEIEADIEAARNRLATTVDHLAYAAKPQQIARRQVDSAKASLTSATRTESGELRVERVVAAAVAVLALIGLVVYGRRR